MSNKMLYSIKSHPRSWTMYNRAKMCLLVCLIGGSLAKSTVAAFEENAIPLTVPSPVNTMILQTSLTSSSDGTIPVLLPLSPADYLFTLSRKEKGKYIPVSRSYNGHDWEQVAGPEVNLQYTCEVDIDISTDKLCQTFVPVGEGLEYHLTAYDHDIEDRSKVARFLERTTFGPTTPEIDEMVNGNNLLDSMALWVEDQVKNVSTSSHREFFRKRLNPRSTETYKYGISGPKACEQNSRWRTFAFTRKDLWMSNHEEFFNLEISTVTDGGDTAYVLSFAGSIRTVIYGPLKIYDDDRSTTSQPIPMDTTYKICKCREIDTSRTNNVNAPRETFSLFVNGTCEDIVGGNPTVNIDERFIVMNTILTLNFTSLNITNTDLVVINEKYTLGSDLLLTVPINHDVCATFPDPIDNDFRGPDKNHPLVTSPYPDLNASKFNPDPPVFGILPDGSYAIHDYRLEFDENTIENPLMDGGGNKVVNASVDNEVVMFCANAPQTIFNEEHCKLSYEPNVCSGYNEDLLSTLKLDTSTLISFYDLTARFVYAVEGLRFDDTNNPSVAVDRDAFVDLPCDQQTRSRWIPVTSPCNTSTTIDTITANVFEQALATTNDANTKIRDIFFRGTCHPSDVNKTGMVVHVTAEDRCYQNVHPDHMSVYDFTAWSENHPGGSGKITMWNETGLLSFPSWHDMSRWELNHNNETTFGKYVGRYDDFIKLSDLPIELQTTAIANTLGANKLENTINNRIGGTIVCGSQGEIAPDPFMDDHFDITNRYFDSGSRYNDQKKTVWMELALNAPDQLRQRMAWVLSKILVVDPNILADTGNSEANIAFYDIFVRNALGNYRDVLREVAFHPKMGLMLTYIRSWSLAYYWHSRGELLYPDENFARELFQLFSIGLVKLNIDGTPKVDRYGIPVKTFDTKDIVSFARSWTGFNYGSRRGNYEDLDWATTSYMDPMRIEKDRRDVFPKRGLEGRFIGDRYPLCIDLPDKPFLRVGAKYRLLGGSSDPKSHNDDSSWDGDDRIKRVVLTPGSSDLHTKLCNPTGGGGACTFNSIVTIDMNLQCYGAECNVDTLRVVQVEPGVFYEYLRQPCIQMAFFEGGKKISAGWNNKMTMCAHAKMPVATSACCGLASSRFSSDQFSMPCEYLGERISYTSNENRCLSLNGTACDFKRQSSSCGECCRHSRSDSRYPERSVYHWTTEACSIQMVVKSNGLVGIVHNPNKTQPIFRSEDDPITAPHVSLENTMNHFSIHWEKSDAGDELFPSIDNGCGNGTCIQLEDSSCFCKTTVVESFFQSMPSRDEVLLELQIGAFPVDIFDSGDYVSVANNDGVEAFRRSGETAYTVNTIFKVTNEYRETIYLKNMKSYVQVGSGVDAFTIRNPPHFMDIVDPETRDAYYETEAVLDHVLHHENTAPFLSSLFIQHFGISNPSPRYVETVARTFQTGSYEWTGGIQNISIGDGKWGNLAATVAAIVLDREATSVVLDADPSHGSLLEPVQKLLKILRSFEYTRTANTKITDPTLHRGMSGKIGQMVYEAPDVFSFFSSDYSPGGAFSGASLVSPESEILSLKTTIGMSNGLLSLIRHGMNPCEYGIGLHFPNCAIAGLSSWGIPSGNYNNSVGRLDYSPTLSTPEDIIDEMSTLMTSGRLSAANKLIIAELYNSTYQAEGADMALRVAQQLLSVSPEFHATNLVRKTGEKRTSTPPTEPSDEPYKAIIYIHLFGGMDSFYMLSPHTTCPLYTEYAEARGNGAKLENMVNITVPDQPCGTFGVNKNLPILKTIYDSGHGMFIANAGHLAKQVTKFNYFTETRTQLFSHHSMEKETYLVDPFREKPGTGVLGRMLDVLQRYNHAVEGIGINDGMEILDGDSDAGTSHTEVIGQSGVDRFYSRSVSSTLDEETMRGFFDNINGATELNSGLFANHWSQTYADSVNQTETLRDALDGIKLNQTFPSGLGRQLEMIAKLIKARGERGTNRDAFVARMGGFDSHANMKATLDDYKFPDLNRGIEAFYREMEAQGMLDKVTVIFASEFGRTITSNTGGGTDHAWGGNYFMFGGQVNGSKFVGNYPAGFTENDPTNDGRGRLIPTTSYDSVWNAIANWYGITEENDLNYVLPNRVNHGCRLYTDRQLYKNGRSTTPGCDGEVLFFDQGLILNEARYLTGEEQKLFCKVTLSFIPFQLINNSTMRCVIIDQRIEELAGRRKLQSGGSFQLTVFAEISTSADANVGNTEPIGRILEEQLNNSRENIVETLTNSDQIQNLTGVTEVVQVTLAPTSSPTAFPTTLSPTLAPQVSPTASPASTSSPTTLSPTTVSPTLAPQVSPTVSPTTASPVSNQTSSPTVKSGKGGKGGKGPNTTKSPSYEGKSSKSADRTKKTSKSPTVSRSSSEKKVSKAKHLKVMRV